MKKKLIFIFICGLIGLSTCLFNREMFTANSLIETHLFCSAMLFLAAKYTASKIIAKYQDPAYAPSKSKKQAEKIWVSSSFGIIQPICLNLLYGCIFLYLIKFIPVKYEGLIATKIYFINKLNEDFIKTPLLILTGFLSILTLLEYLSHQYLKSIKKYFNAATFIFKVTAVVVCFIHVDNGVSSKYISWKIENDVKEAKKYTFVNKELPQDEATQKRKEALVKEIVNTYVDLVTPKAIKLYRSNNDTIASLIKPARFENSVENVQAINKAAPFIKEDMDEGFAGLAGLDFKNTYSNKPFVKDLFNEGPQKKAPTYKKSVVETAAVNNKVFNTASEDQLKNILNILKDEKTAIGALEEDVNAEIIKDMGKETIGKILGLIGVDEHIKLYGFIKENVMDFSQENMADAILYMCKKKRFSKSDLQEVSDYTVNDMASNVADTYKQVEVLTRQTDEMTTYYTDTYHRFQNERADFADKSTLDNFFKLSNDYPHFDSRDIVKDLKTAFEGTLNSGDDVINKVNIDFWDSYLKNGANQDLKKVVKPYIDKIVQKQAYITANTSSTSTAYTEYLQTYPNDPKRQVIEQEIRKLKSEEALALKEIESDVIHDPLVAPVYNDNVYRHADSYHPFPVNELEHVPVTEYVRPVVAEEERGFWYLLEHIRIP